MLESPPNITPTEDGVLKPLSPLGRGMPPSVQREGRALSASEIWTVRFPRVVCGVPAEEKVRVDRPRCCRCAGLVGVQWGFIPDGFTDGSKPLKQRQKMKLMSYVSSGVLIADILRKLQFFDLLVCFNSFVHSHIAGDKHLDILSLQAGCKGTISIEILEIFTTFIDQTVGCLASDLKPSGFTLVLAVSRRPLEDD